MSFRAKCRVTGVHSSSNLHPRPDGSTPVESVTVTMQPVFAGSDADSNKEWSKWTPSGELKLTITNPDIFPELLNGRTFFVDFSAVD